ncbi:hypothetical protein DSO57_1020262 [Entomophthora muscae]|uniref:Uncharacterized protein n=1 Tax=Entomophthora muscae TaxID=34485 RepID=A0ACC2UP71_9FUNG|nr:hypothetical protein DSO57_1020262 [Entomophthora muscae]
MKEESPNDMAMPLDPRFSLRKPASPETAPGLPRSPPLPNDNENFYQTLKRKLSRHQGELPAEDPVRRQKSLVRPERARTIDKRKHSLKRDFMKESTRRQYSVNRSPKSIRPTEHGSQFPSCWVMFSYAVTFYAPVFLLKMLGKHTREIQQAWREKMALVSIIFTMCLAVGFLTFGLQQVLCGSSTLNRIPFRNGLSPDLVSMGGQVYNISRFYHPSVDSWSEGGSLADVPFPDAGGKDISFLFQDTIHSCRNIITLLNPASPYEAPATAFPCVVVSRDSIPDHNANPEHHGCHTGMPTRSFFARLPLVGDLYFTWDEINQAQGRYMVYNGGVLDLGRLDWMLTSVHVSDEFLRVVDPSSGLRGKDVSYLLANHNPALGRCMDQLLRVGVLDTQSIGCISSNIVLYVSLIVILGVVFAKFFMALFFGWVLSRKLGALKEETREEREQRLEQIENWSNNYHNVATPIPNQARFSTANVVTTYDVQQNLRRSTFLPQTSRYSTPLPGDMPGKRRHHPVLNPATGRTSTSSSSLAPPRGRRTSEFSRSDSMLDLREGEDQLALLASSRHRAPVPPPPEFQPYSFSLAHTLLLVTCYSEGVQGLRTTFDSLALTDYPSSHKLLYVVCDGVIVGAGNDASTPDICLSMMKDFVIPPESVMAHSYVAIADGTKRHNMAKVYAGYYKYDDATVTPELQVRVPMVVVVKVGTVEERKAAKPGNRGKRDGQIILMAFLQRIMFDERLSELDYEMFNGMWAVTGVPPDSYEIVLMVDADTKVYPDSLTKMVAVMVRDPTVMGLCGETKIANKTDSWVTMIQVFEYYISHHMSKAFESIFGGVTCLPGCFCMYRIKAPKGTRGYWVPILANPDIVENYSENVVDTLHKKNLLLLGEDRYLTTLMLRTFPKRKMLFVPQAVCKTIVPDEFKVLLSQRRRWINSTVHNLLELVLIRDLCGTFCFSMQFVIFMELVGTVVLPAAITFTLYLIVISFFTRPVPIIPLLLLAAILGLPAVLITFTTRKMVYVGWMLIYLLSLPIWNFVLPTYAYWHFDDFSWGQTRMVEGESPDDKGHGEKEGEFDSSHIVMRRWAEFERDKRQNLAVLLGALQAKSCLSPHLANPSIDALGYLAPNTLMSLIEAQSPPQDHLPHIHTPPNLVHLMQTNSSNDS